MQLRHLSSLTVFVCGCGMGTGHGLRRGRCYGQGHTRLLQLHFMRPHRGHQSQRQGGKCLCDVPFISTSSSGMRFTLLQRLEAGLDWKGVMLCRRKNGDFLGVFPSHNRMLSSFLNLTPHTVRSVLGSHVRLSGRRKQLHPLYLYP